MKKPLLVSCPKCKEEFNYYDSDFRPFCSERCKSVDLGHWFSENYRVPSKENLRDEDIDKVVESHESGERDIEH